MAVNQPHSETSLLLWALVITSIRGAKLERMTRAFLFFLALTLTLDFPFYFFLLMPLLIEVKDKWSRAREDANSRGQLIENVILSDEDRKSSSFTIHGPGYLIYTITYGANSPIRIADNVRLNQPCIRGHGEPYIRF